MGEVLTITFQWYNVNTADTIDVGARLTEIATRNRQRENSVIGKRVNWFGSSEQKIANEQKKEGMKDYGTLENAGIHRTWPE